MKKLIYPILFFISLLLISCNNPTSPFQLQKQMTNGYGYVDFGNMIDVYLSGGINYYEFGSFDDTTPKSQGFYIGNHVYFEAEVMYSNKNSQGGSTFWCKLKLIRSVE